MREYEVYWLTDFPLIFIGYTSKNNYGDLKKANKQVEGKLVILQLIGLRKQGTPADILVGI